MAVQSENDEYIFEQADEGSLQTAVAVLEHPR
jgi:hypothetical protein